MYRTVKEQLSFTGMSTGHVKLLKKEVHLHVEHEDLSCHAHFKNSMYYQFAEGRKEISSSVELLKFLFVQALTH